MAKKYVVYVYVQLSVFVYIFLNFNWFLDERHRRWSSWGFNKRKQRKNTYWSGKNLTQAYQMYSYKFSANKFNFLNNKHSEMYLICASKPPENCRKKYVRKKRMPNITCEIANLDRNNNLHDMLVCWRPTKYYIVLQAFA